MRYFEKVIVSRNKSDGKECKVFYFIPETAKPDCSKRNGTAARTQKKAAGGEGDRRRIRK